MNEVISSRDKDRSLFSKDDLKVVQQYVAIRLEEELSKNRHKGYRALARYIIDTANRVDGKEKPAKGSSVKGGNRKGIDILVKRISEIGKNRSWKEDLNLQEKVIQRLYKGLEEKKLTTDDIGRLKNLIEGDKNNRLGDRSDLIRAYFDLPTQTDQLLREFLDLNKEPQPILICGYAFGRTLEQARRYIPERIAKGYSFHFLVYNSFSTSKYREAYSNLFAYHYFEGDVGKIDYNCHLSLKYLIQTMYRIKALYNTINERKRVNNKKDTSGLRYRSDNGGKGFLGKKFQVAFYDFPLFYHGIFSNLPDTAKVNRKVDYQHHFITPEINECERAEHPIHAYVESNNLKPAINLYKTSIIKQWRRATKTKFDREFTSLPRRGEYNPRNIEEEAKMGIENVVEECNLGENESIFDYFRW